MKANELKRKTLTFAYSTSAYASKYNKGKGCWLVFLSEPGKWLHEDKRKIVVGIYSERERFRALRHFESLNFPVNIHESFTREYDSFKGYEEWKRIEETGATNSDDSTTFAGMPTQG